MLATSTTRWLSKIEAQSKVMPKDEAAALVMGTKMSRTLEFIAETAQI